MRAPNTKIGIKSMGSNDSCSRHPGTQHLLNLLAYDHLPPHLQKVSKQFSDLGYSLADSLGNSPEIGAGLRKLVEAKDCFVRQAVIDAQ
jgi:hypothetical protein